MIVLKGSKRDRFIIEVRDTNERYKADLILTYEELLKLNKLINKKI